MLTVNRVPAIDTYQVDRMKLNLGVNGAMAMCSNTVLLDIFSLFHSFQDAFGDGLNIANNIMSGAMSIAGGLIPSPEPPEGRQREGFDLVSLSLARGNTSFLISRQHSLHISDSDRGCGNVTVGTLGESDGWI